MDKFKEKLQKLMKKIVKFWTKNIQKPINKLIKTYREKLENKRVKKSKQAIIKEKEIQKNKSDIEKDIDKVNAKKEEIEKRIEKSKVSVIKAIEIKNFSKVFKKFFAVKEANFTVSQGVIHGFLGPNGSGKTTTIKCLIGSQKKSLGKLLVFGNESGSIPAKAKIGYIPESARFPRQMNTIEYLINMAKLSGIEPNHAYEIVKSILESMNLWQFRFKKPVFFSSGMQKKLLMAQSLINNPSLLILDEPAENLDPTTRNQLYNELVRLQKLGKTIFISSHVLAELNDIVQEITILRFGKVLFSGRTDTITSSGLKTYLISSSNDDKLLDLLLKEGFSCKTTSNGIVTKVESESQGYMIQNIIYRNNLYIKKYTQEKKSLQDIYDRLVLQSSLANKKANLNEAGGS